jgi:hypothetical protein
VIDLRNGELLAPHSIERFEPALESDNPSLGRTEGSGLARVADGFKPVHGLLECFDLLVDRCSSGRDELLVTLPAIVYLWSSGAHGTAAAVAYTVMLVLADMADNVLKPLLLGRGVEAPMPVILLGALGGMAAAGILGMFVGATLLTLGYQIFMGWVAANPHAEQAQAERNVQSAR